MHWCRADVAEAYGDTNYSGQEYFEQTPVVVYPDNQPLGNTQSDGGRQPVSEQFPGRFENAPATETGVAFPDASFRDQRNEFRDTYPQENELPSPDIQQPRPRSVIPGNSLPTPNGGSSSRNDIPDNLRFGGQTEEQYSSVRF